VGEGSAGELFGALWSGSPYVEVIAKRRVGDLERSAFWKSEAGDVWCE